MDRFVAMVWNPRDEAASLRVELWRESFERKLGAWRCVFSNDGVCVFTRLQRAPTPIVTEWESGQGVIIGALFERGSEHRGRLKRLEHGECQGVLASQGKRLTQNYWGNYVALWRHESANKVEARVSLLRDPCGAIACLTSRQCGVELVFAHIEDVALLPGVHFSIDWTYLRAFTLFNYFVTAQTGLVEVKEVLAGQCVSFSNRKGEPAFSWAWNAADIASEPDRRGFLSLRDELRETAQACAGALGDEYGRLIVSLSGGLDSSILAALLRANSDAELIALHYLGIGYEQHEARLARLAAAKAGIELVEAVQDPALDRVTRILYAPRLARPKIQSLAILIDDVSRALADARGASAFAIGQGGDNLFLQSAGARNTFADYLHIEGVDRRFWAHAYDAAMLQQRPVLDVLARALAPKFERRTWRPFPFLECGDWAELRPFSAEALLSIPPHYMNHPWFEDAQKLPHGKADHVASVVALYNYHMQFGRGLERDVIYPFFAQPIAEFALKTPTYTLCQGGHDRALERAAFADLIPAEIGRRTAKGGANLYLLKVMERNLDFYRRLILDGEIVAQDWIDRRRVETMLRPEFLAQGAGAGFIYLLVAAEAWLHNWRNPHARAAAA